MNLNRKTFSAVKSPLFGRIDHLGCNYGHYRLHELRKDNGGDSDQPDPSRCLHMLGPLRSSRNISKQKRNKTKKKSVAERIATGCCEAREPRTRPAEAIRTAPEKQEFR